MNGLFSRFQEAVRADLNTIRHEVASPEMIEAAEDFLGLALPKLLKRSYLRIGNGGFGPGPIIGLPGGFDSSWGDLLQTWAVFQEDEECEEGWLPIIDWGCAQLSMIDCDDSFRVVTLYEGDFHPEDDSFQTLISRWLDGEIPELHTGGFFRPDPRGRR